MPVRGLETTNLKHRNVVLLYPLPAFFNKEARNMMVVSMYAPVHSIQMGILGRNAAVLHKNLANKDAKALNLFEMLGGRRVW